MPFNSKGKNRHSDHKQLSLFPWLMAGVITALVPLSASAAGPRMGEVYLGVGSGFYAPKFDVSGTFNTALNPPPLATVTIALPNGISGSVLTGAGDSTATDVQTENLELISFDAIIGYQITHSLSAEVGIDLAVFNVDIEGLETGRIGAGSPETLAINVMPPELLPITFSAIYNFFPQSRISPYLGFGALLALLNTDTHQSQSDVNDLLTLEGGLELGYFAQAGARFDISKSRYFFVELKYGRVSNPELTNRLGIDVDAKKFEIRHLKFGLGYPFSF
ncbi:MAG: hypothetical protein COB04_03470 [Gammaproteobacteria bacterium]|nr:MAG: hypothetical protein COB04_03470 [Gammaproteobacteria bacterium]